MVDGLLGVFGEFLKKFGKQILLKGLADLAIGNVGQGLAEIAAGTALIAGGALASASAKPASSTQASGSGSLNTSASSSTRPYNPTVAPGAAAQTAPAIYKHQIFVTADGRDLKGVLELETDRFGRVVGRG